MPRFTVRPLAWIEINADLDFLEGEAGVHVSERMLDGLMKSFEVLANNPEIGVRCGFRRRETRRLRRWPVKGFENWLIFYEPSEDGVEIVHVLHGAQDIQGLLD